MDAILADKVIVSCCSWCYFSWYQSEITHSILHWIRWIKWENNQVKKLPLPFFILQQRFGSYSILIQGEGWGSSFTGDNSAFPILIAQAILFMINSLNSASRSSGILAKWTVLWADLMWLRCSHLSWCPFSPYSRILSTFWSMRRIVPVWQYLLV